MKAEELIFDDCSEGQEVKELSKGSPDIWIAIFAAALIIKAIDLSDLSWFMISPQDGESVPVAYLKSYEESDCLNWVMACIEDELPLST